MESATIGDDIRTKYEFEWEDGRTRTTDEIGDLSRLDATMDDIVDAAKDDPECTVKMIGFEQ